MDFRRLMRTHPDAFVQTISDEAGRRLRQVRGTDLEQVFWIGILEAMPRLKQNEKQLHFLLSAGFGAMRDYLRSEYSRSLTRWCRICGRWIGYRTVHNHPLDVMPREKPLTGYEVTDEDRITSEIELRQFVEMLDDQERTFCMIWFNGGWNHPSGNHLVMDALDLSPSRVSQIRKRVATKLRAWRAAERGDDLRRLEG